MKNNLRRREEYGSCTGGGGAWVRAKARLRLGLSKDSCIVSQIRWKLSYTILVSKLMDNTECVC